MVCRASSRKVLAPIGTLQNLYFPWFDRPFRNVAALHVKGPDDESLLWSQLDAGDRGHSDLLDFDAYRVFADAASQTIHHVRASGDPWGRGSWETPDRWHLLPDTAPEICRGVVWVAGHCPFYKLSGRVHPGHRIYSGDLRCRSFGREGAVIFGGMCWLWRRLESIRPRLL